jgi:DNA polymerase III delta prime subunit
MDDILRKYHPQYSKDLLGNKQVISNINKKIKTPPCRMLILGPSGSGKSTLVKLAMKEYNYDILEVHGGEAEDMKTLKSLIDNFSNNKTIESFFSKREKIVFIDDVDILIACDRNGNSFLMNFVESIINSPSSKISFIMTASTSEEKKLTELKKKVEVFRISNPNIRDVFVYVSDILEKEKIDYQPEKLLKLIESHNNNIRNVLNNLHQMNYSSEELRKEKQKRLLFDANIFDVVKKVYNQKMSFSDFYIISDNNLIPLLLYENYQNELFKTRQRKSKDVYISMITNILDAFIDSDVIEHHMYKNTDWSLFDLVTILRCGPINWNINNIERKKASYNTDNYVFTQLLTKNALRCNYGKRLAVLKDNIKVSETEKILYIFDMISEAFSSPLCKKMSTVKKIIKQELGFSDDDLSTMFQYFSQFLMVDRALLARIKKAST